MAAEKPELLRPQLAQAQQKLEAALDEACDADVKEADTAELIRLEESLAIASAAAKQAISVRKRLRAEQRERGEKVRESHRHFDDDRGVRWDTFAVYPSGATVGRAALPEPYLQGWLSFDSGAETRRLAPIPDGWKELPDDGLRQLVVKAEVAPKRKR